MRFSRMLIHRFCRLRAPVALHNIEVQRTNAVLAGDTLESDATVHRFGCVMSHNCIVASYFQITYGH